VDKINEKLKEISLWCEEKHILKICPECKSNNLVMNDELALIQTSKLDMPTVPSPNTGMSLISMACLDCGFIRFFSANIMGVVQNNENR